MSDFTVYTVLTTTLFSLSRIGGAGTPLSHYIQHFEPLHYEQDLLHRQHHIVKRSTQSHSFLTLEFYAHGRTFKIRLKTDSKLFSRDVVIENSHGAIEYDVRRFYVGYLEDEDNCTVHGVVTTDGIFEGKIITPNQVYVVERARHFFSSPKPFHSVIYKQTDVNLDFDSLLCKSGELHRSLRLELETYNSKKHNQHIRLKRGVKSENKIRKTAENEIIKVNKNKIVKTKTPDFEEDDAYVQKRAVFKNDPTKTTCTLYVQADHLFYKHFSRNQEMVIEQLTQHVQGVNAIYKPVDFDAEGNSDNVNFIIKRIKVHTDPEVKGYKYDGNYGVENFLAKFSEDNFDDFCLAYMFTYRDFEGGTLGLAWTGDIQNAGGVCEKHGYFRGSMKSLNSGIVTVLNYGKDVPSAVSHVTLAHEIGHNMGSQHDPDTDECSPGGVLGNYIMFAKATSGDKPNNNRFSTCSKTSMRTVMATKARGEDGCFIVYKGSICGNEVVDPGEECDCGWEEDCHDNCCWPQRSNAPANEKPCTRKPNAICSPSEGPCCTDMCRFVSYNEGQVCRQATSCTDEAYCNGSSPVCPLSRHKPDKTRCDDDFVCYKGECTGSICMAYDLLSCQCPPDHPNNFRDANLCKLCCRANITDSVCRSSFEWNTPPYDVPDLMAKPGTPCNDYNGYCDVFQKCREVDPSGPLSALKKFIFTTQGIANIKDWLTTHWYVIAVAGFGFVLLLTIFVKLCSPAKRVRNGKKQVLPDAEASHKHDNIQRAVHMPKPNPIHYQVDHAIQAPCSNQPQSHSPTSPVILPPPEVPPRMQLPTPRGHRANRQQVVRTQVKYPEFCSGKNKKRSGKEGWV